MVGLYLESAVLLHQLTTKAAVKARLREQIVRACRHLYRDAFRGAEVVKDMPQYRWRGMWYFWGGRKTLEPKVLESGEGERLTHGDLGMIRQVRELNSTVHHAFGYAYYVTGDEAFKRMGDEIFDASYGDQVDGIHCLADSPKAKDYDMNYRAAGRYLVWRLTSGHSSASAWPQPVTVRNATVTTQHGTTLRSSAAVTSAPHISAKRKWWKERSLESLAH